MDTGLWMEIANLIIAAYALIPKDKRRRTRDQEAMLNAVTTAYHNTHAYYADREKGMKQDRAREYGLASDWETAGHLVEKYDRDLALRLGLKSKYWRDGGTWSDDEIENAGIELERVRVEASSMFKDTRKMKKKG